jgi:hypothetical protein
MEASGVAQVVAKHGDELLAQLGSLMLVLQLVLARTLRGPRQFSSHKKLLLVAPAVGGPDESQANGEELAVRIPPLGSVGDRLQRLSVGLQYVDREFLEGALHPQQRCDMRFVVDPTRYR